MLVVGDNAPAEDGVVSVLWWTGALDPQPARPTLDATQGGLRDEYWKAGFPSTSLPSAMHLCPMHPVLQEREELAPLPDVSPLPSLMVQLPL